MARRLVLIGNGFDLAHNLPTRYVDFLKWYVLRCFKNAFDNESNRCYKDGNIESTCMSYPEDLGNMDCDQFIDYIRGLINKDVRRNLRYSLIFKNKFLERLYSPNKDKRWVDIEMDYYNELRKLTFTKTIGEELEEAYKLQEDFANVKKIFAQYIGEVVMPMISNGKTKRVFDDFFLGLTEKDLVLNFNYTDLPQRYAANLGLKYEVLNIHGDLRQREEDIVFGFGDERDDFYAQIENLNDNKLFEHVKSFSYLKNGIYSSLERYINQNDYNVETIGLSCGISDRTLLGHLFEHPNCQSIRIFYYKNYYNYRQITMEVSRHFGDKISMRKRVLSFNHCQPCPQASM